MAEEKIQPALMAAGEYRCEECGGVFAKAWSDAEAIKEREELFPDVDDADFAIVCEDCFRRLLPPPE